MLGVVLAGGEGRRMGRDKALMSFEGEALWQRQVRVLRGAGTQRVVVARRREQEPIEFSDCQYDVFADSGPMGGIHAAMAVGGHPWLAVLAVDMPAIDSAWFLWLRSFCRPGVGAIARHAQALEPLAAIYPQEALADVEDRLLRRELSVSRWAAALAAAGRMELVPLAEEAVARVASLNAPPA